MINPQWYVFWYPIRDCTIMILLEVVNDESIASNGPGEEYAVSPEGHLDHTPKVARTILVRDSVSLTKCFENL